MNPIDRDHVDELRDALARHREAVEHSSGHEFVDHQLAESLHRSMDSVLDRWFDLSEEHQRMVARAVAYLVDTDDDEHDLRSPIGFVDDAEQIQAVLTAVAPDLLT